MSFFLSAAASLNTQLAAYGEPITYTPAAGNPPKPGTGTPFPATALPDRPGISQSTSKAYFMDIHVDPSVVTAPVRGDLVTWADGTVYEVTKVAKGADGQDSNYGMFRLALHIQSDPASLGVTDNV